MTAFTDQLDTDLTGVFFNAAEFAEAVSYTPVGGAARSITICYGDQNAASQTPQPPGDSLVIWMKYSDASAPLKGDAFTIDSVTWYLDEILSGGRLEKCWEIRLTRSARRNLGGGLR